MANISKQISQAFGKPNIAATYGPYASLSAAHAALAEKNKN